MTCNAILLRYGEIALKGGNRRPFEKLLVRAIRRALTEIADLEITRERGRITLGLTGQRLFTDAELALVRARLQGVFGLVSFSPGMVVDSNLAAIERAVDGIFPAALAEAQSRVSGRPLTFGVRARRSDKSFPMISTELSKHIADRLLPAHPEFLIDLIDGDLTIAIEVRRDWAFVYSQRIEGPGGMPADCAEPGIALLSGGIDSPVAAYLAMKRGIHLDFLTFHSFPYTNLDSVHKVARLARILNQYQRPGRLFACNLSEAQKLIRDGCTASYRTILYRRLMARVGSALGGAIRRRVLVTGEAVGQVASQTIPNLTAIDDAATLLVIRPLICADKEDAIAIARRIGTMPISIEPCADSCTVFAPKSPSTGVNLERLRHDEAGLDLTAMVAQCLAATSRIDLETFDEMPFP